MYRDRDGEGEGRLGAFVAVVIGVLLSLVIWQVLELLGC